MVAAMMAGAVIVTVARALVPVAASQGPVRVRRTRFPVVQVALRRPSRPPLAALRAAAPR
jgi:hypothetical protein